MQWNEILKESQFTGFTPSQIFQEQMQKAVLTSMSRQNVFRNLVFQGGTALRMFYNNPRFSEDLDFVLVQGVETFDIARALSNSTSFISSFFPFLDQVKGRIQKQDDLLQRYVLTTQSTVAEQRIRLHVEVALIPAYHHELRILSFPPLQPVIRVETREEILADKLLALGSRSYLKGRDLWDIYYLTKEQELPVDWELIWTKAHDYQEKIQQVKKGLQKSVSTIDKQGIAILDTEMKRFLPPAMFSMYQDMFRDVIEQVKKIIGSMEESL